MLPEDLQRHAASAAERQGISLGELIRRSFLRETSIAYQVGSDQFWEPPTTFRSRGG